MPTLKERLFRHSSTSRRNRDVADEIRPLLTGGDRVLDAGCGELGLAPFLAPAAVVGVDLGESGCDDPNFQFIRGSITQLPLEDRSVAVAASVDTLEHLPEQVRGAAVRELVRVARTAVVLAFPRGEDARRIDDGYRQLLRRRNMAEPDWLEEHLASPYPEVETAVEMVVSEANRIGRPVDVKVRYSEWSASARLLRTISVYSEKAAMLVDLMLGPLVGLIRSPGKDHSYRAIVVAQFVPEAPGAGASSVRTA